MLISKEVFSREDLQRLREETLYKKWQENIDRIVQQIKKSILDTAINTENQTYFYSIPPVPEPIPELDMLTMNRINCASASFIWSKNPEETRTRLIEDIVSNLQKYFPGVSIVYKSQSCIKTKHDINHGIYIDWSPLPDDEEPLPKICNVYPS
jgi:hypothetical protein